MRFEGERRVEECRELDAEAEVGERPRPNVVTEAVRLGERFELAEEAASTEQRTSKDPKTVQIRRSSPRT